ncbi:MAG: phosphoenolpyruvate carboxykinase (ATP), partial [Chitinophagaceae bacterium]
MNSSVLAAPLAGIRRLGLTRADRIRYQLTPEELVDDTLRIDEGEVNDTGALVIQTGEFTGRSPKDKFIVKDAMTEATVDWNEFNNPISEAAFDIIHANILSYLNALPEVWVRDAYACADPRFRLNLRVVNEKPWNNLFSYNMFLRPSEQELEDFEPEWTILSAPGLRLDPVTCGTRQHNATVVSFTKKIVLIAGSGYTGETKKSVFTILNYLLPMQHKVLSMHCSANAGRNGDTAIFFGLSGTGKTTLSADPNRQLIGDDEHGWNTRGVFNFEGGCYAKTINLSAEKEPGIYQAIRFGALVENTMFRPGTNHINFDDSSVTENTRVSYPIDYIENAAMPSVGNTPTDIFFLTCDAFGVLPPLSKLDAGQAMFQFISGYTAKIAGTEAGITEPKPTFSACFGAPFIPLHPTVYAGMLGQKMREQEVNVWLVNTGWTGGEYGTGKRMPLKYTRAMITAVLDGKLTGTGFRKDPLFGFDVPVSCPGVPADILD